ncbi:hypothetical protein M501DRAFT_985867 [Patellaria atrata CBS 101060]|uniref:Uncharacterized protein n=1 Tax=Patellaria atrata CBS 101060 TaxID=1346257 RepID=A0A9P4SK38_9PEZI|nr:hypothetical protein M501DRAFT_985867 [Patellaria atrata CBS 101060]
MSSSRSPRAISPRETNVNVLIDLMENSSPMHSWDYVRSRPAHCVDCFVSFTSRGQIYRAAGESDCLCGWHRDCYIPYIQYYDYCPECHADLVWDSRDLNFTGPIRPGRSAPSSPSGPDAYLSRPTLRRSLTSRYFYNGSRRNSLATVGRNIARVLSLGRSRRHRESRSSITTPRFDFPMTSYEGGPFPINLSAHTVATRAPVVGPSRRDGSEPPRSPFPHSNGGLPGTPRSYRPRAPLSPSPHSNVNFSRTPPQDRPRIPRAPSISSNGSFSPPDYVRSAVSIEEMVPPYILCLAQRRDSDISDASSTGTVYSGTGNTAEPYLHLQERPPVELRWPFQGSETSSDTSQVRESDDQSFEGPLSLFSIETYSSLRVLIALRRSRGTGSGWRILQVGIATSSRDSSSRRDRQSTRNSTRTPTHPSDERSNRDSTPTSIHSSTQHFSSELMETSPRHSTRDSRRRSMEPPEQSLMEEFWNYPNHHSTYNPRRESTSSLNRSHSPDSTTAIVRSRRDSGSRSGHLEQEHRGYW